MLKACEGWCLGCEVGIIECVEPRMYLPTNRVTKTAIEIMNKGVGIRLLETSFYYPLSLFTEQYKCEPENDFHKWNS